MSRLIGGGRLMVKSKVVLLVVGLVAIGTIARAGEVYLPIVGTVGIFSTDARILNPSYTDAIEIQAYLLALGNADNTGAVPITIEVPPREMAVYDNVLSSMFDLDSGLAALRLVSDDPFHATARIFSRPDPQEPDTLGQFFVAEDPANAKTKGVLLQLRSGAGFRSNLGFLNPNDEVATVVLRLFDVDNEVAGQATVELEPMGVIGPSNMLNTFTSSGSEDLTDGWVSYTSNLPVIVYGSVLDNFTEDPTTVPGLVDVGVPPEVTTREFTFDAHTDPWAFDIKENGVPVDDWVVNQGDHVVIRVRTLDTTHGFMVTGGYVSERILTPEVQVIEFDANTAGSFIYSCTVESCGEGHRSMKGGFTVLTVGKAGDSEEK